MDKLTLEHLAPYLAHGLKMTRNGFIGELKGLLFPCEDVPYLRFQISCSQWWEDFEGSNPYKPILRPLSIQFLISIIHHADDMEEVLQAIEDDTLSNIRHDLFTEIVKNHGDIHGLIEKGLAVDINTIESEVTHG